MRGLVREWLCSLFAKEKYDDAVISLSFFCAAGTPVRDFMSKLSKAWSDSLRKTSDLIHCKENEDSLRQIGRNSRGQRTRGRREFNFLPVWKNAPMSTTQASDIGHRAGLVPLHRSARLQCVKMRTGAINPQRLQDSPPLQHQFSYICPFLVI